MILSRPAATAVLGCPSLTLPLGSTLALMPWCLGALVPWCLGALVPWCGGTLQAMKGNERQ